MDYNKIYKNSKKAWGDQPSKLLQLIIHEVPKKSYVLDLGCGQGKDSLYLARNQLNVTAVENSEVACNQLLENVKNENDINIDVICQDVMHFEIENNKYSLIIIKNILHFLDKTNGIKLIKNCIEKLNLNGLIIISSLTNSDPAYNGNKTSKTFFYNQELLTLFKEFQIIYYYEGSALDNGHAGSINPHNHEVARIVAKKIHN